MNEIVLRHKEYVNLSVGRDVSQSVGQIISTINIIKIWIYFISLREKSSRLLEKNTRAGAREGACPWGFNTHALPPPVTVAVFRIFWRLAQFRIFWIFPQLPHTIMNFLNISTFIFMHCKTFPVANCQKIQKIL